MKEKLSNAKFNVNESENQFELEIGNQTAYLEYVTKGDKIYLTHTNVPNELEGHGVGSELVKRSLQHIKGTKTIVFPLCSFVAHYIDNHPEYQSMLSEGYQM